jgi:hypothetical protein
MTLKILILTGAISSIVSCNSQRQKSKVDMPSTEKTSLLNCYRYINKLDTVILKTTHVNDSVTGTLVYNFYQENKYSGTIQGVMKGEVLIADFTFFFTGVKSVRQVAFKKKGKNFIEGYGETEVKNGKTTFKNIDSLKFTHSIVLLQDDCEN